MSEADVAALFTLEDALGALRRSFAADPAQASTMRRGHARSGERILHAVGGLSIADGVAGTKTWLYSPGGAAPLTILYGLDGGLLGVVEAFRLGQWRTAATTGLGTDLLAPADADVLALLGTGRQALAQARAVAAVRPLRRIQVWGRDRGRLDAFVERASAPDPLRGVEVVGTTDLAAALDGARVVVAITRAAEAFLGPQSLPPGVHVNAVGAIVPSRSELTAEAVGRFDVVAADSVEQARADSGELRAAADAGLLDWDGVRSLHELLAQPDRGRRDGSQLTLFKALGVGLSDVALGAAVLRAARAHGRGTPLPATPDPHTSEVADVEASHS